VNSKYTKPTERTAGKGLNIINRDAVVFIFFLFLSFGFWYLNSLGKEAETGIKYPVVYSNLPKDKVITDESSQKLNIFLKGPGYSILKLKFSGNKSPVIIDISKVNYIRVPGSKNLNYFIVTSTLTKSLTVQLRSGCEITSIKPDTLFFAVEKAVSKGGQGSPDKKSAKSRI
jgi:hypothetical protein